MTFKQAVIDLDDLMSMHPKAHTSIVTIPTQKDLEELHTRAYSRETQTHYAWKRGIQEAIERKKKDLGTWGLIGMELCPKLYKDDIRYLQGLQKDLDEPDREFFKELAQDYPYAKQIQKCT